MKKQNLFLRGKARIKIIILLGLTVIFLISFYSLLKKSAQEKAATPALSSRLEEKTASLKGAETKIIKVGTKNQSQESQAAIGRAGVGTDGGVSSEDNSAIRQPQQAAREKLKPGPDTSLATDLESLPLNIEEGERIKTSFRIANTGSETVPVAIYKSEFGQTQEGAEVELEKLLYFKNNPQTIAKGSNEALQTSVYAGAPELMLFPQYADLAPGEEKNIDLTINAKQLDSEKDYTGYLYAVGTKKEDSLLIPIQIQPAPAPRISLVKIAVDDGFSADTRGNSNNVANPNETVAVTMTLENKGNAPAQNLDIGYSSIDNAATFPGGNNVQVPLVDAHAQIPVRALMKVSAEGHPIYPPAIYLTMTDSQGRQWQESFYTGEEGKFQYPTGLISEKEEARR